MNEIINHSFCPFGSNFESHRHVSCSLLFDTPSAINYSCKYSIFISTDIYHSLPWANHCPFPLGYILFLSVPSAITPIPGFINFQLTGIYKNHPAASRPTSPSATGQVWWIFLEQSLVTSCFCSSACSCLLPITSQFGSRFFPLVFKFSCNHFIYPNLFPLYSHLTILYFNWWNFTHPSRPGVRFHLLSEKFLFPSIMVATPS